MEDIEENTRPRARPRRWASPTPARCLPAEAHTLMPAGAKLVDVRTKPELLYVGTVPGSRGDRVADLSRQPAKPGVPRRARRRVPKDDAGDVPVPLRRALARRGRGRDAAGWKEAYNVLEGFEGDKDAAQHRNTVGGWRKAGLPWMQS